RFIVDGRIVGHNLTAGPRITEKNNEKRRLYGRFGGGSAYFNASDRLHFFQASACGRDMSRDNGTVKNRPKSTRKSPSAGKSTCISVAILTWFAGGRTLASLAMGRGHSRFSSRTPRPFFGRACRAISQVHSIWWFNGT